MNEFYLKIYSSKQNQTGQIIQNLIHPNRFLALLEYKTEDDIIKFINTDLPPKKRYKVYFEKSILVSAASPTPTEHTGNFKEIMRQCLAEVIDITRSFTDVPFQNDDVRAICSSLFIARTR